MRIRIIDPARCVRGVRALYETLVVVRAHHDAMEPGIGEVECAADTLRAIFGQLHERRGRGLAAPSLTVDPMNYAGAVFHRACELLNAAVEWDDAAYCGEGRGVVFDSMRTMGATALQELGAHLYGDAGYEVPPDVLAVVDARWPLSSKAGAA